MTKENKTLVKKDIIDQVGERLELSPKEAQYTVESLLDIIKDCLASGEAVKISGFGKFVLRDKRARRGRNPTTGEDITVSERRVLTFRPSLKLRNVLNP